MYFDILCDIINTDKTIHLSHGVFAMYLDPEKQLRDTRKKRGRKKLPSEQELLKKPLADMPDELAAAVECMTPFQRKYCEYKARGLSMGEAAVKAGSKAQGRAAMNRVGYQIERMTLGAKEYILYLQKRSADVAMVSQKEITDKLREVYTQAMAAGKYADANKALELLGNAINMFKQPTKGRGVLGTTEHDDKLGLQRTTKNNVNAFKEEGESVVDIKKHKYANLLKEIR